MSLPALTPAGRRSAVAVAVAVALLAGIAIARNAAVIAPLDALARTQADGHARYQGSWHFPRGGPYILGFEASTPARLFIDGRQVATGAGQQSARRVYEPGAHAVRFELALSDPDDAAAATDPGDVEAGARLLWHPPGRRGPLEYVPPSSLSAAAPAEAEFGQWAGASPLDGLAGGLCLLVLLGLALFLARAPLAAAWTNDRRILIGAGAVAVLALGVRLYDLGGAGQTWDEDVNWSAGRNYITNWLALDFRPGSWVWNYEHPPVMKYIAGIGAQWADGYDPARALSALLVALGCALLVPIGQRLYRLRVGVLAGLIAALSPHLIAHGKIVGHEAPTVLWWALAIWLALRLHDPAPVGPEAAATTARDPMFGRLVVLGLVLGLAVFSRFVNALLVVLVAAIAVADAPPGRRLRTLWLGLAIAAPVAIAVGVALWPRLWDAPVAHLAEAWAKLRKPHSPEPFLGHITNQPGRHYFALYLAATAPVGVLAGAIAWIARALARRRREARATRTLLLWLAVPMIVTLSPVRQDGVRYIMPCLLALAVLSAAGLDQVVAWLAPRVRGLDQDLDQGLDQGRGYQLLGALFTLYLALVCARVHPYYLDYYGEHVGGPATVAERRWFEVAWWGEGIADAIAYVNTHAAPGARVFKRCVEPSHLTWLRADLWPREAPRADRADWAIVYQPSWRDCPLPPGAELVHEVSVQGAPLVRVYRRPDPQP
ncbi:glycosyltransferase family 39 protein [Haliangium sp.]|uniref:glycosyltransferase family 39 protein n=1 Tax=Haliangium sp. TaxID=2663208 RepID=UPI003D0F5297